MNRIFERGRKIPKTVWLSILAFIYLLCLLVWKIIQSIQSLPGLQAMRVSVDSFVEGQSQWDRFVVSLFVLGFGVLFLWGLVMGKKLARYGSLLIFPIGVLLTIGGYMSGDVSARWETALRLFCYLLPSLAIIVSLSLPPAGAFFSDKISWKSFGRWFGLGVAGILLFVFSWGSFMVWLSKDIPTGK